MKKLLLWTVALVVAVIAVLWAGRTFVDRTYARREWTAGLGSLDEVPQRFPRTTQSAAATKLIEITAPARIDLHPKQQSFSGRTAERDGELMKVREELGDYLEAQLERSGDAIEPLPPLAAQYLSANAATFDAARDLLLSGQRVVWDSDVSRGEQMPLPNLYGQMHLQRALIARALDKARTGDASAWNELRASWEMNRGMWNRPDWVSLLIALATTRMANGAARKMPLPAPEWLNETFTFDYVNTFARSQQAEAWVIRHAEGRVERAPRLVRPFVEMYYEITAARAAERMRSFADQVVRLNVCDSDSPQFAAARASVAPTWLDIATPNIIASWNRVMRFRAELEATQRVLQMRMGQTPAAKSQCTDGAWTVTPASVKFSRDPAVPDPGIKYPLEYMR